MTDLPSIIASLTEAQRDLLERLRGHATDWNGKQMPDIEPAKGDPTAGDLRLAATLIESLSASLREAESERDVFSGLFTDRCADLAAAQERIGRLEGALQQWKCPSCGGKLTYPQISWPEPNKRIVTEVPCKVCEQTGLHPIARAALTDRSGE